MKAKLTKELCYIAGLSRLSDAEKSLVYIKTDKEEIAEKFVESAIKLGVDPKKIIIESNTEAKFYHSKIASNIREIRENKVKIFKYVNELSRSFVAGIFDARGIIESSIKIAKLSPSEILMLNNLGIKTNKDKILNAKYFIMLIKGFSVRIEHIQLPGNERDPR